MANAISGLSSLLDRLDHRSSLVTRSFIAIGVVWSTKQALNLLSFASIYTFGKNSLNRYITPTDDAGSTWALVTGASDGIGKGFAEELLSRGVNVVLHGRNEQKLLGVKDDLLRRWPSRQVRLLVLDAGAMAADSTKLDEAAKSTNDLNLRILINNVGGNGTATPLWAPLIDRSCADVGQFLDIGARFPTELTRVVLPQLIQNQPSLIVNIGSGVSDFASPYLEMYSGVKAYNQAWSRSLRLELQTETRDVEVLHFQVGMVSSNTARRDPEFLIPSSRQFAKCGLNVVGCGREVVWPYWPHALQFGLICSLPDWLRNRTILGIARKEMALDNLNEKEKAQ